MRQKIKERTAKPLKDKTYKGELVVLIDSNSASASEVFARVVQLEKRGKVVGDVSAGAVMTSISLGMANVRGPESLLTFSVYGISVTIADLIMADGKRLENAGVIPDYLVGPTGTALFAKTDPVLSYAASLFGAKISAEEAGQFYFITSKPEGDDDDDEDVTVAEDN
jgi:C-terminal processing protease CtpA/Prc